VPKPLRSSFKACLGMAKPVSGSDNMVRGVDISESVVVCVNPGPCMATLRTFLAVGYGGSLSVALRGYKQITHREYIKSGSKT